MSRRLESLHDYLWAIGAILLAIAVPMYGWNALAVWEGDEPCVHGRTVDGELVDTVAVHQGYVPLEFTCEFADGTVDRLVPVAASVVLHGGLAGAVVSLVVAWTISRRLDRRAASADSPG
ncbi:hypothetical protein E1212_26790 [Jiangella ureilytica]|uniref:Uncharacterized protein n=1 Tax=Jiangella ureilytica TaxID=2530374 RepID=A0A4V2XVS0_9ACTN|nr:hypothetical protein [Jiangella ureilytica]TDC46475.1 hypothetical protein E1212_26790 [Jiangella ureilytica]